MSAWIIFVEVDFAPSGLNQFISTFPGALPLAITFHAFSVKRWGRSPISSSFSLTCTDLGFRFSSKGRGLKSPTLWSLIPCAARVEYLRGAVVPRARFRAPAARAFFLRPAVAT